MSLYLLHLTEASPAPVYTKSYLKTLPSLFRSVVVQYNIRF